MMTYYIQQWCLLQISWIGSFLCEYSKQEIKKVVKKYYEKVTNEMQFKIKIFKIKNLLYFCVHESEENKNDK